MLIFFFFNKKGISFSDCLINCKFPFWGGAIHGVGLSYHHDKNYST